MQNKKTILITGSEGKVGSHIAKKFKEFGWNVAGIDLLDNPSKSGADIYVKCDVRSSTDMIGAARKIESQCPVDALFTAAGTEITTGFEETKMEDSAQHGAWRDFECMRCHSPVHGGEKIWKDNTFIS